MSRSIPGDALCNGVKGHAVQFRASDGQEALEKSQQMRNSRSQERDARTPSIDLAVPAGWSHHLHLPVGHLRLNKKKIGDMPAHVARLVPERSEVGLRCVKQFQPNDK